MLWSLLKIAIFICVVAALAYGASQLLEAEGGLRIAVANTEFVLGPLQTVIAALLLILAVWILIKLLGLLVALVRFLNGDETALSRWFYRSRERKGYRALADGMLALAEGEGKTALAKAHKAERYLRRPDITDIMTAQAAELAGDHKQAETVYKKMLADDRTRFVGVRGILKQKLAAGDTDTALALAEKAFALKPRHEETQDTLLRLQAGHEDWSGARKTLGAKLKYGSLPRDVHRRRDAVLALSEAREIFDEDRPIEAREAAIEANRLSPDLVPAAALAARGYIENGQERYAARVIKKAWTVTPHPDLASAFAAIRPDESPQARIKRFNTLTRLHPDHPETRMLLAELNIADEDFPAARRALGELATKDPTARAVTIMAAIERGEGADDAVVRGWLAKALTVRRGPAWVCGNCQHVQGRWAATCENCGAFDTLAWKEAPTPEVQMPAGSGMLPLIVGRGPDTGQGALVPATAAATAGATSPATAPADAPASNGPAGPGTGSTPPDLGTGTDGAPAATTATDGADRADAPTTPLTIPDAEVVEDDDRTTARN